MVNCLLPDSLIKMAQATEAVYIILKEVWIDGPDMQSKLLRVFLHSLPVIYFIPGNMNGDTWANTHNSLYLCRVIQLLTQCPRRAGPMKHLEARPRISIAPGRRLDAELSHRLDNIFEIDTLLLQAVFYF